ncbi:unnamed protein product [Caenorhabditis bovis]|uniref:B30.2/SPRY domain-containing protein n=1 Tax=Caenorhabditis bovis TaxID=2654633 RepID=A0A8S1EWF8_9PELO|nr:unnamed protein product [Caenorhabditis bovis]
MRNSKGRRNNIKSPPTTVCYCNGKRELGSVEIVCSQCLKWFHGRCLKECNELQNNGVPFMICYTFTCKECRPSSEDWKAKKAELVHMCVTVFASMTAEKLKCDGKLSADTIPEELTFFSLKEKIIPYMDENWNMLTSIKKRGTWHQNLAATLLKEKNLFAQDENNPDLFALAERNLTLLGPLHEAVKHIGKRAPVERGPREERVIELPPIEGPKTRGASKRRNAEGPAPSKKQKLASDYSSTAIAGSQIDIPYSKDGYRYYFTEKDPNVFEIAPVDEKTTFVIPPEQYRIVTHPIVAISSNDRAYQLGLEQSVDGNENPCWLVTGHEGYAMARATHGVTKGTWYFEVKFEEQPAESHIRIGWSQAYAALQACVGYNKFSYGWRSKHGTKFHDARGKTYFRKGFKEGDVLGCLIHLPTDSNTGVPPSTSSEEYLPPSHKNATLISFKNNLFFEVHDEAAEKAKHLKELPESKIEFFHNGKSCGVAFENIYGGCYFPAVSLFHKARVNVNFGPKFVNLPQGAKGMHLRAEEQQHEQTLSDILHLVAMKT